ncbi:MAG: helix-turn-helix domain-containing protein [Casimicrobiaceae bacterium]
MEHLSPKNHGEEVAVFRHGLIGELAVRELDHGERSEALRRLSEQRVRAPGSDTTRRYSVATLERWLYAFKQGGLEALVPRARGDRGRGRDLDPQLRELLCDIRREHPSVSVKVILRTLLAEGRMGSEVTACTVRRMLAERGLTRTAAADGDGTKTRLRWQAECPGALWHGDVCHGPTLKLDGKRTPVRVHGLLDDASRYGINLRVYGDEREERMLSIFGQSLLEHGKPSALYLDNGATYRGDTLQLVCSRLGITLLHARPYDAPARGKMERFWRRMREEALSHIGHVTSLLEVELKLRDWLARYYQGAPHAGILGRTPATRYAEGEKVRVTEDELRAALTIRVRRRVRRDTTISVNGIVYEIPLGYLAGQTITVATSLFDGTQPVLELDGKRIALSVVDPTANNNKPRPPRRAAPEKPQNPVDFEPGRTLGSSSEDDSDDDIF